MRGVFSPGRTSASLAQLVSSLKGSSVLFDACNFVLAGKYISLFDFSFIDRFMSSVAKFDVPPESITNFVAHHLSTQQVHLFEFVFSIV
jgi:hypothetical protein